MRELDDHVKEALQKRLVALEDHFQADCVFYYGPFFPSIEKRFREFIELLRNDGEKKERLVVSSILRVEVLRRSKNSWRSLGTTIPKSIL